MIVMQSAVWSAGGILDWSLCTDSETTTSMVAFSVPITFDCLRDCFGPWTGLDCELNGNSGRLTGRALLEKRCLAFPTLPVRLRFVSGAAMRKRTACTGPCGPMLITEDIVKYKETTGTSSSSNSSWPQHLKQSLRLLTATAFLFACNCELMTSLSANLGALSSYSSTVSRLAFKLDVRTQATNRAVNRIQSIQNTHGYTWVMWKQSQISLALEEHSDMENDAYGYEHFIISLIKCEV